MRENERYQRPAWRHVERERRGGFGGPRENMPSDAAMNAVSTGPRRRPSSAVLGALAVATWLSRWLPGRLDMSVFEAGGREMICG
jgi:hypothetical protein